MQYFAVVMQSMAGLEDVRCLRHLCLYSNEITKIDRLDHLTDLELLWLNDNNISVIEVFLFTVSLVYVQTARFCSDIFN